MSQTLQSIREAAIDGRAKNIIWRQIQLENLQRTLIDNADTIQAAIQQDSAYTSTETAIEYCLTLKCLNENYKSLDIERALKDEYAIARGHDSEAFRDPVGVVYIVPTTHNFFYSIVSAVGAAITAGNCVVIEVSHPKPKTFVRASFLLSINSFKLLQGQRLSQSYYKPF